MIIYIPISVIFSQTGISVSAVEERRIANMSRNSKMLHVTTASAYKTHTSNETINFLTKNFVIREKSDKEIWLFGLDISVQDMLATKNMYESL